ncbi:hypothetical protein D7V80_16970 [Corallococcus sp. CA054B]|uniref:JmjC domain-containing protein n=1 Tax=Corallococcus sp. CA054B TaxID=2316734 RepID=UPI000EA19334|nr:cupin domain-containing protein [Corallococcus sp. CA054B]RKG67236.1 hypothetical protein D7V80_16970 [Corallococcus sp. CA054B]
MKPRPRSARVARQEAFAPPVHAPSLEALLGGLTPVAFLSDHWEQRVYHLSRGQPDFYAPLLPRAEIDHLIASALALDPTSVELLPRARPGDAGRPLDAQRLQEGYDAGNTLRVNAAHRFLGPLRQLRGHLEQELSALVNVNLYCAPARSETAQVHFDRHCFVLQVSGRRKWSLSPRETDLPLEYVPPFRFEDLEDSRGFRTPRFQPAASDGPTEHFVLEAGDLLYLPRGHVHESRADGTHSVHLTLGFKTLTYVDCLASALYQLAHREPALRRSLPPGFLLGGTVQEEVHEELRRLGERLPQALDVEAAVTDIARAFLHKRGQLTGMTLGAEDAAAHLGLQDRVERRAGQLLHYSEDAGKARLQFGQRTVSVPADFGEALRFIQRTPRFQVRALPGPLDDEGRLALVGRLTREGLLYALRPEED